MKRAFQDGPDFYDNDTPDSVGPIASYGHLVKNDWDMDGAAKARTQFLAQFPDYEMVEDPFAVK